MAPDAKVWAAIGVLAAALILIPGSRAEAADGETPPLLTLDEAVEIALEKNNLLRAADAQVGMAEAVLAEARASRMPRVEILETFSRTTNPTLVFSSLLGQESFGPENFAVDRLNEPDALSNLNSRLSISQPVWTGGRIRNGTAAASLARDASDSSRERARQEVVHQVIDAYTAAVLAAAQMEVAKEAVRTATAHVELVRDLRDGGLVVESDLLQARVRLSEVEELLIRASSAVAVSRAAVNLALGRDTGTPFSLPAAIEIDTAGEGLPLDRLVDEARKNRPDLRAARTMVDVAERNVKVQRAERLPQVNIMGGFEANAERALDVDGTNWSILAAARFTVFDGRATGARVRRADQQRLQAERMHDLLALSVELDVHRAFHDLRAARKRREQTEQAVALAREGLRIVEDRYKEGLTTVVELLDAETALTRARTRETAARRDVVLARASLELAMGRL